MARTFPAMPEKDSSVSGTKASGSISYCPKRGRSTEHFLICEKLTGDLLTSVCEAG